MDNILAAKDFTKSILLDKFLNFFYINPLSFL